MTDSRDPRDPDRDPSPEPDAGAPPDDATLVTGASGASNDSTQVTGASVEGQATVDEHPKQIGRYRILSVLGKGGMGVVYRAEQTHPIRREVALKTIISGMDSHEVVRRFESERQALARMEHQGIAKVFDAGVTPEGRLYFVMEYVDGVPLGEYSDRETLGTRERLELLVQVGRAIQHAHQRGIIHRDLKPSNVLIAEEDGRPVAKVIDFGIAKAADTDDEGGTRLTQTEHTLGTPAYMSPEQLEGAGDVDTRTDVYALGVMLYEALSGTLPYESQREGGVQALVKRLSTDAPPMVARLNDLGDTQVTVAKARGTVPQALRKELGGDLTWIATKALERDVNRRYDSVAALVQDVERYLADEPIEARAPTPGYRLEKFVRRNKVAVAAGAVVFLGLAGGATAATVGMVRAQRAEAEAVEARNLQAQEAATAQAVSDYLTNIFQAATPEQARGRTITAQELLDTGAERVRDDLADQPVVQAEVLLSLAQAYWALDQGTRFEEMVEEAIGLVDGLDDPRAELTLARLLGSKAGFVAHAGGFPDMSLPEVLALRERVHAIHDRLIEPGDPVWIGSLREVIESLAVQRNGDRADSLILAGIAKARERWGGRGPEYSRTLSSLGNEWTNFPFIEGRDSEERGAQLVRWVEESVAAVEGRPEWSEAYEEALYNRAWAALETRPIEEALPLYEAYFARLEQSDPPLADLAGERQNYAYLLNRARRFEDSERQYLRAIEENRQAGGGADVGDMFWGNLQGLYMEWGRPDKVLEVLVRYDSLTYASFPDGHPVRLSRRLELVEQLEEMGMESRADSLLVTRFEEAARFLSTDPAEEDRNLTYRQALGEWLQRQDPDPTAIEARIRADAADDPLRLANSLHALDNWFGSIGASDRGDRLGLEALAIRRRVLPQPHPDIGRSLFNRAIDHAAAGRNADALSDFLEADRNFAYRGDDSPSRLGTLRWIGRMERALGRPADALAQAEVALGIQESVVGPDHIQMVPHLLDRGNALLDLRRWTEARRDFRRTVEIAEAWENPMEVASGEYGLLLVDHLSGENPVAPEALDPLIGVWEEEGWSTQVLVALQFQADLYEAAGNSVAAGGALERAADLARGDLAPDATWTWFPAARLAERLRARASGVRP